MLKVLGFDNKYDAFKRGKDWVFYEEVVCSILEEYKSDVDALLDGEDLGDDDETDGPDGDDDLEIDDESDDNCKMRDSSSGSGSGGARRFKEILATMQDRVVFYVNMFFAKIMDEGKEPFVLQEFWEFKSIGEATKLREETRTGNAASRGHHDIDEGDVDVDVPQPAKDRAAMTFLARRTQRYLF